MVKGLGGKIERGTEISAFVVGAADIDEEGARLEDVTAEDFKLLKEVLAGVAWWGSGGLGEFAVPWWWFFRRHFCVICFFMSEQCFQLWNRVRCLRPSVQEFAVDTLARDL